MVLRKEDSESQAALVPAPLSKANPPYPTTPLDEHPPMVPSTSANSPYAPSPNKTPAFTIKTPGPEAKTQGTREESDSDYSEDEWNGSDDDDFEEVDAKDLPDALKPAGGKPAVKSNALPDALRPGPPAGVPIKRSIENISPMPTGASSTSFGAMSNISEQSGGSVPLQTNNPYLKAQQTGQSNWGGETSQQIWGDSPGERNKYDDPVELPAYQTPTTPSHDMANLSLRNTSPPPPQANASPQPPVIAVDSPTPLTTPQSAYPPSDPIAVNPWEPSTDAPSVSTISKTHSGPQDASYYQNGNQTWDEQPNWGHSTQEPKSQATLPTQVTPSRVEDQTHGEEISHPLQQTSSTNPFIPPPPPANWPPPPPPMTATEEQPPALPPRRSHEENAPPFPPRPLDTNVGSAVTLGPESPNARMNRQRKEHYQIKHIRWHDVNKPGIRTSPILTQNLNGPCPLLALVNALVLSTPPGIETALVETLRTREQVSLGLLLDAVFDELMSGRRGTAAQDLPDVTDLYKFLLALHTGLNVNPMFVPDNDASSASVTLTSRPDGKTGGFENTHDMKLYRTFNIPLLHGWLPEPNSEAYAAFNRIAKTYETSQYVQFQEEELIAKLHSADALTPDEQQMFKDIHAIQEFLTRWPTQLTDHGLKVMAESIQPGQVAILFRNDHFSTLSKDPRTNKLMTLVTDQGYATHDEIVWESLVDVNGLGSELFSGDFRPVGNTSMPLQQDQQEPSLIDTGDNQGWTTVPSRRNNQLPSTTSTHPQAGEPTSPNTLSRAEQEDHDLALALQLQEEEEDRERREAAQRERDNEASVSAIAARSQPRPNNRRTSHGETPPVIPPRRNNITTHRPATEPAPPPTYEEASTRPQYHPPQGHPANPQAPLPTTQGSAYQANGGVLPPRRGSGRPMPSPNMGGIGGRLGRRQSAGLVGHAHNAPNGHGNINGEERERCVVM